MAVALAPLALRLGDELLLEHCETGDDATTFAVGHAVEILAQAIAAHVVDAPGERSLRHLTLPMKPGPPQPTPHAAQVSCHALAARLRSVGRRLGEHPEWDELTPVVLRLAASVEEHALGLHRLATRAADHGAHPAGAARETVRLHRILLAECRAVVDAVTGA